VAVTNRWAYRIAKYIAHNVPLSSTFYLALAQATPAPTFDTNVFSELAEIAAGSGYLTGGILITRDVTDFDVVTEDDALNKAYLQMKDIVITASGGNIPPSGSGFRYIVLLDNNVTVADREVLAYWDLGSVETILDTQFIPLQNLELGLVPA
jgi:hypothetical protein